MMIFLKEEIQLVYIPLRAIILEFQLQIYVHFLSLSTFMITFMILHSKQNSIMSDYYCILVV